MRTIVFFDLPNVYSKDKRAYLMFRKFLINEGFLMMQESVYSKIVLNSQQSIALVDRIRKKAPKKGIIQVMIITGTSNSKIINNEERLIVL